MGQVNIVKRHGTFLKIFIIYVVVLMSALFAIGMFSIYYTRRALDKELSRELMFVAELAGRETTEIIATRRPELEGLESTADHILLAKKIETLRAISGIERVIILGAGNVVIIDSGNIAAPGDIYTFPPGNTVNTGEVWSGKRRLSGRYEEGDRVFRSAFVPVRAPDKSVLFIAATYADADLTEQLDKVIEPVKFGALAVFLLTVIISYWLARSITTPLEQMVEAFENLERRTAGTIVDPVLQGEYPKLAITGRNEFSYLGEKFNQMVASLEDKDRQLTLKYRMEKQKVERIKGYSGYILESIPIGVIYIDTKRRIRIMNKAALDILGISGYFIDEDCNAVLKSFPSVSSILSDSLELKKRERFEEIAVTMNSGAVRWLGISSSSIYDQKGELLGATIIFPDLTSLKQLQNDIKIKEKLAAIGELAAGIAHEIRNPLAAMQGFVELLGRESQNRRLIDATIREIENLNKLISEFLDYARLPKYDFQKGNIKSIIDAAASLSFKHDDGKYRLTVNVNEDVPDMEFDFMYMQGVFINLIKNGLEAMPGGGEIKIGARKIDDSIAIELSDTGAGIKPADMDRIFNPFYTTKKGGTGLGLSIVRKTIENHGGTITVNSKLKEGTTFRITLPVSRSVWPV